MPVQVLVLMVIMVVPVAAIVMGGLVKLARIRAESGGAIRELEASLRAVQAENAELRRRLENVEVVVSDGEWAPPTRDATEEAERSISPRRDRQRS